MSSNLEFKCSQCSHPVYFSVLKNQNQPEGIQCEKCKKKYELSFQITEQLRQFEALCKQIQESKSIFGQAAIAVDVGSHQVKIPFQLLLTRLSSVLELNIGGKKTSIGFKVDTINGNTLSKQEAS